MTALEGTFDEALARLIDTRAARTELREQLTLAGHRVFRLELVATGDGTRTYGYVFRRRHGPPLFVHTSAQRGERVAHRDVVDHAARTLRLFPVPPEAAAGLPEPVDQKRRAILFALAEEDVNALAALADQRTFTYTFGAESRGGFAEHLRRLEAAGERPREQLARVLALPYTLSRGHYVWPFAYDKTADELTTYERELLEPLGRGGAFSGGYLGWRAGITPDGRWVFFVAGD